MSEKIILENGGFTAVIDPVGASCVQFSHAASGVSVLHADGEQILTGMPPIFPLNRIDGGHFVCAGVDYHLPINEPSTNCALHGSLYTTPFSVVDRCDDRVVLRFESGGNYPGFAQDFAVTTAYRLSGGTLVQQVEIENRAGAPLPVLLGVHTTFEIPFCPGSTAADVQVQTDLAVSLTRDERNLTSGRQQPDDVMWALCSGAYVCGDSTAVSPITRQFLAGTQGNMTLFDRRAGVAVRYLPDTAFAYRMIYSPGGGFFCYEPQTCAVNAPNLPADSPDAAYPTLDAGQKMQMQSVLELIGIG